MLINVRCKCGRRLKVTDAKIGKTGTCPACHATLRMIAPNHAAGQDEFDYLLAIIAGPLRVGEIILLAGQGPIEIGKLADKHLTLAGAKVSRGHCRLVRDDGCWRIEDHKSTNGLFVNRQRVGARTLKHGDVIQIGEYALQFASANLAEAPATTPQPVTAHTVAPTSEIGTAGVESPPNQADAETTSPDITESAPVDMTAFEDENLYGLSDGEAIEMPANVPDHEPTVIRAPEVNHDGPTCPSCGKSLAANAKICVTCGIDLKTGRAILTSHGGNLDAVYDSAERIIRWLSWFIWFGIYPVSSEGFGLRKPYFTWAITAITILASMWFWAYDWTDSPQMASMKNYMLWTGNAEPEPEEIVYFYSCTNYGDSAAFEKKCKELHADLEAKESALNKAIAAHGKKPASLEAAKKVLAELRQQEAGIIVAAHKSLPPEKQYQGRYRPSQLLTHAFLHGGIMHLAGNMLFLLVIGSRINALVGNLFMIVLYPILAVVAGIIFMTSQQGSSPLPCLGASGAIMGLSGMYLVLMPIHRIHMVAWLRPVVSLRLMLLLFFKIWSMRGFWVVLFYIAFDVLATIQGSEDGVAHWAHLGGFIGGMAIGLLLLFTKLVNCRGGDIVSGLLGKRAWALVGKPDLTRKAPLEYGW